MRITTDPNTDASGFDYVEPNLYRLRVVKVEQRQKQGSDFPYLNWELELADPNVKGIKGKQPGHIFEITTLKTGNNSQFRLMQVCNALGISWGEFDTDDVVGLECDAYLKVKEYNGVFSNEVDKFISVTKD